MADTEIEKEIVAVEKSIDEISILTSEKINVTLSSSSSGTDSDFTIDVSADIENAIATAAECEASELVQSSKLRDLDDGNSAEPPVNIKDVATREIQNYVTIKATKEIFEQILDVFLPQMQTAAKSAFQIKAHGYLESQNAAIRALSWIPGAGEQLAIEKLASVKEEAIKQGNEAAKTAAGTKKIELMPQIDAKAKEIIKLEVGANKEAIIQLITTAVEDAKKQ